MSVYMCARVRVQFHDGYDATKGEGERPFGQINNQRQWRQEQTPPVHRSSYAHTHAHMHNICV